MKGAVARGNSYEPAHKGSKLGFEAPVDMCAGWKIFGAHSGIDVFDFVPGNDEINQVTEEAVKGFLGGDGELSVGGHGFECDACIGSDVGAVSYTPSNVVGVCRRHGQRLWEGSVCRSEDAEPIGLRQGDERVSLFEEAFEASGKLTRIVVIKSIVVNAIASGVSEKANIACGGYHGIRRCRDNTRKVAIP